MPRAENRKKPASKLDHGKNDGMGHPNRQGTGSASAVFGHAANSKQALIDKMKKLQAENKKSAVQEDATE